MNSSISVSAGVTIDNQVSTSFLISDLIERGTLSEGNLTAAINDNLDMRFELKQAHQASKLSKLAFDFTFPMQNLSAVIGPDSGRWFFRFSSVIDFWKNSRSTKSYIGEIREPLFVFAGDDGYVDYAFGVFAPSIEMQFDIIEPVSNRALNVHTGNVHIRISLGTVDYPLNSSRFDCGLFIYDRKEAKTASNWLDIHRSYTNQMQRFADFDEHRCLDAFAPFWCSWVDWDSKDLSTEMLINNIENGTKVGVSNFIIDDGWYGNGLDCGYSEEMNIGDWCPDAEKIPDICYLIECAHNLKARVLIWCAPHAVGRASSAFREYQNLLLSDKDGKPIINQPQYYSYCFCNAKARLRMVEICTSLALLGFDGIKLDLFNWVPIDECKSTQHSHDIVSPMQGLQMVLSEISARTHDIKKNFIIELKQDYSTGSNSRYGDLIRAGDSPFDIRTNFLRMLHIQGYTPKALNDYQSFTSADSPQDIACIIIVMMSVGVPAYGCDFSKLEHSQLSVIKYYNNWYSCHHIQLSNYRDSVATTGAVMKATGDCSIYFAVSSSSFITIIEDKCIVLNGTFSDSVPLRLRENLIYTADINDCFGKRLNAYRNLYGDLTLKVPKGGSAQLTLSGVRSV